MGTARGKEAEKEAEKAAAGTVRRQWQMRVVVPTEMLSTVTPKALLALLGVAKALCTAAAVWAFCVASFVSTTALTFTLAAVTVTETSSLLTPAVVATVDRMLAILSESKSVTDPGDVKLTTV